MAKQELTQREWASRGGHAHWKGLTKEQRSEIIKARWAKGRLNKAKK